MALGDALGAPHEFRGSLPLDDYTGLLIPLVLPPNRAHPRRVGVPGQVTDDTEMSVALLGTIAARGGGYDPDAAAQAYIDWALTKPAGMGTNTRELFGNGLKTTKGYRKRWGAKFGGVPEGKWTQSNGCLMRASPLALARSPLAAAAQDCRLTNPHPVCEDACVVYVATLRAILDGTRDFEALARLACGRSARREVGDVLEAALRSDGMRDVQHLKGWVLHALWCAFRALRLAAPRPGWPGASYQDVIDWVIRLGGDTDTNAAIAGAVVGAWYGLEGLKAEERTGGNLRVLVLEGDTSAGQVPRPGCYHPRALAQHALALGQN